MKSTVKENSNLTKETAKDSLSLTKDYTRASGMVMRVGKAVLGLVLFGLTRMGKVLINKLDSTGLPSSTGDTKKRMVQSDVVKPS